MDGGKGYETLIADSGYSPAWSPDGYWIAYEVEGDIWKVSVNVQGTVFGEPVQLTNGLLGEGHPTWSADSQTIVFHAGMTPDYDLWSMPAAGGAVTWLNGAPGVGDYDPAFARNSDLIAYASASLDGQAVRNWGAAFIGDVRTWNPGEHSYHMQFAYTLPEMGGGVTEEISFTVSDDAPGYAGFVLLRPHALRARVGEECPVIDLINPDQPARFHFAWVTDDAITYSEAQAFFGSMTVSAYWDEGMSEDLIRQDVFSWPSVDWEQYICLFTDR